MLKDQDDGPHLYKKATQFRESHQLAKSDKTRVTPGHYNPPEEVIK